MSLAPTLLKIRTIAPGVGSAGVLGLTIATSIAYVSPSPAAVTLGAEAFPTLIVQEGPTAAPETAPIAVTGLVPSLLRTLVVSPGLADLAGESNDLTPTLVWGGGAAPAAGAVGVAGLAPALIRNGEQTIYPSTGAAILAPLVPAVSILDSQSPVREPARGQVDLLGYEPTLLTQLVQGVEPAALAVIGLAPTLVGLRYDWQPVAPATATWTRIPGVS